MLLSGHSGITALGFAAGLAVGILTVILLRRRRAVLHTEQQFTTRFMYSGNLKQTNLLDAIQFLEIGRREGILQIYDGKNKGYLAFSGGRIIDAFFQDQGGKEAVFRMLELENGDFFFESRAIQQPCLIVESMMDIALEWDAQRSGGALSGSEEWGEGLPADSPA